CGNVSPRGRWHINVAVSARSVNGDQTGRLVKGQRGWPHDGPVQLGIAQMLVGLCFGVVVGIHVVFWFDTWNCTVFKYRLEVRNHHEASYAGLLCGVNGANCGVTINAPRVLWPAATGTGRPDNRIAALQQLGQGVCVELFDVGDDRCRTSGFNIAGMFWVSDDGCDRISRIYEERCGAQGHLSVAANKRDY